MFGFGSYSQVNLMWTKWDSNFLKTWENVWKLEMVFEGSLKTEEELKNWILEARNRGVSKAHGPRHREQSIPMRLAWCRPWHRQENQTAVFWAVVLSDFLRCRAQGAHHNPDYGDGVFCWNRECCAKKGKVFLWKFLCLKEMSFSLCGTWKSWA